MRIWTDRTGQHQVRAVLLSFANGTLRLRRHDGHIVQLTVEQLSLADAAYIQQLGKESAGR